jgi:outer membrane autotransporter protein
MSIIVRNALSVVLALLLSFVASAAYAQCGPAGSVGISSATGLLGALNTVNTSFLTQTTAFVAGQPSEPDRVGGGVWARGIGGRQTLDAVGTVTFLNPPAAPAPCPSRMDEKYAGFQFGADIAKLNVGGWNLHLGATGGMIEAEGTEVGGPARGHFQVPFLGVYATAIHGGFFADIMLRRDFYLMRISQFQVGLNEQNFNGRTFSVTSSAGYYHSFGNWFIEPSAGVIWARFDVDQIAVAGNAAFNVPAGTLNVGDIDSLMARAGIRTGTSIVTDSMVWLPFVTASVWHEFADNARLNFTTAANVPIFDLSASRIGTYGQYGVGVAGQVRNTGWLGYARFDYRNGENVEGWGLNAGLRYQFGGGAPAAMPVKAPTK